MRWQLMALAVAVVLAGCATPDPFTNDLLTASIAPGTGRKSVAVISAIGDTFSVQKVGLTVFQTHSTRSPSTPGASTSASWPT
jgi:outer membrane lipoprotein SlyB